MHKLTNWTIGHMIWGEGDLMEVNIIFVHMINDVRTLFIVNIVLIIFLQ
jgi:hypothetical protein